LKTTDFFFLFSGGGAEGGGTTDSRGTANLGREGGQPQTGGRAGSIGSSEKAGFKQSTDTASDLDPIWRRKNLSRCLGPGRGLCREEIKKAWTNLPGQTRTCRFGEQEAADLAEKLERGEAEEQQIRVRLPQSSSKTLEEVTLGFLRTLQEL